MTGPRGASVELFEEQPVCVPQQPPQPLSSSLCGGSVPPHRHQHLGRCCCVFAVAILVGVKWRLVVLIGISLRRGGVGSSFMCLWAISLVSSGPWPISPGSVVEDCSVQSLLW